MDLFVVVVCQQMRESSERIRHEIVKQNELIRAGFEAGMTLEDIRIQTGVDVGMLQAIVERRPDARRFWVPCDA